MSNKLDCHNALLHRQLQLSRRRSNATAQNLYSIFQVNVFGVVVIDGLGIQGGYAKTNGGGVANYSNLTLEDDNIAANDATQNGGGIFNSSGCALSLLNDKIELNNAGQDGGGISNLGIVESNCDLDNTIVFGNKAAANGGGIDNLDKMDLAEGFRIDSNTAQAGDGGGVYNIGSGNFSLYDGIIYDNGASGHGGGVFHAGNQLTLNGGTLVEKNDANQGGGIRLLAGTTTLDTVTVSGNQLVGNMPNGRGVLISQQAQKTTTIIALTDDDDGPNGPVQG